MPMVAQADAASRCNVGGSMTLTKESWAMRCSAIQLAEERSFSSSLREEENSWLESFGRRLHDGEMCTWWGNKNGGWEWSTFDLVELVDSAAAAPLDDKERTRRR